MSHSEFDAIVIGAGHNGLTTAAYLAKAGRSVKIFEHRDVIGGACVTEEIDAVAAPGCRVSTASYIASMLRPEIIRDLELAKHGLHMQKCDPRVQIVLDSGEVVAWWNDEARLRKDLSPHASRDEIQRFIDLQSTLHRLAKYLEPLFLRPPLNTTARGFQRVAEITRIVRQFRKVSGQEALDLVEFSTCSLEKFLDKRFDSPVLKQLMLADNVYGKHGGPKDPGSAFGLLFHLLSGGEASGPDSNGFSGHVMGGMGAITTAMAEFCKSHGVKIETGASVSRILISDGRAQGVELADGTQIRSRIVVSNADPKRTFLSLVDPDHLTDDFRRSVAAIKMDGPCAKINFVLSSEPVPRGMAQSLSPAERSLFIIVPTMHAAQHCYDIAKMGEIPEKLWIDCVVPSNVDPSLATEGHHVMTSLAQYVPYKLASGSWESRRDELLGRIVDTLDAHIDGFKESIVAARLLTPMDLEHTFGLTEGNIFHGDLSLDQLFSMRPVPGWAHYATPVSGLYLCGAGTHPGGGVTGAPGYNAAKKILRDI